MVVPYVKRGLGEYTEYFMAQDWILKRSAIGFVIALVYSIVALPLTYMVGNGFTYDSFLMAKRFLAYIPLHPAFFVKSYFTWVIQFYENPQLWYLWLPTLSPIIFVSSVIYGFWSCPFQFVSWEQGGGRPAGDYEVKNMGLLKGTMIVLGLWKGKLMRMTDCLSVLCVGGAGTGKTAGVVIPNILTLDNCCLIIHDLWGTIYGLTAGHRAKLGPVFRVCFEGRDDPEKGVFYPTWNPLAAGELPPPSPGRQSYIGGLCYFLIEDGPQGTDPYWITAGRSCLEGLMNYLCDKIEQARANDYFLQRFYEDAIDDEDLDVLETYYEGMQKTTEVKQALADLRDGKLTLAKYLPIGSWTDVPDEWIGRQQSLPMLLDVIYKLQVDTADELRARRDIGDPVAFKTDVWAKILNNFIEEAAYFGYNRRALVELNQILALPKSQRGTVLSVAMSGLSSFKLSSVRCRTASSDFFSIDYRGIKNPFTGKWEPTTFYLDSPSKSPIALVLRLFMNMTSGTLTVFGPSEGPAGPFDTVYLLDDFGFIPSFGGVFDGVAIGRSKRYAFLFTCTDLSQLNSAYGNVDVLISQTGAKILMRLDNNETIERFMGLVDAQTFMYKSESRTEGPNIINNPFEHSVGYAALGKNIIRVTVMSNLAKGTQFVLCHKDINHPIKSKVAYYFKNQKMLALTRLPEPPYLPTQIYEKRNEEDKLPPQEIQFENAYEKTIRLAALDAEEDMREIKRAAAEAAARANESRPQDDDDNDDELYTEYNDGTIDGGDGEWEYEDLTEEKNS